MKEDRKTVLAKRPTSKLGGSETHALISNIPDTVPVLQETTTNKFQAIKCIDQSLAGRGIVGERPDTKLAAWNGQVERGARL